MKIYAHALIMVLIQVCCSGPVAAQDGGWSDQQVLSGYLEEGARNNPGVQAAFARWQAALEKVPQATAWPDPKLTFGVFVVPVETRTGPQRMKYGLSQQLPWFGKRDLKGSVAEQDAVAMQAMAAGQKLSVYRDISNAFYEYAYLGRALDAAREEGGLLEFLESVVESRYRVSGASYADLTRVQVERARIEERLVSLEEYRHPLAEQLRTLLGRPAGVDLPLPASLPQADIQWPDSRILETMTQTSQALAALDARVRSAQSAISLAEKERYPDLTVGVESISTDAPRMRGVVNEGKDPLALTFGINIPLDWSGREAAVRQARSSATAARLERADKLAGLEALTSKLLFGLRDASRRLTLLQETIIPKARQNFEAALDGYQAGQARMTDLLAAEKTLIELELQQHRTRADHLQRLADLDAVVGQEIPRTYARPAESAGLDSLRDTTVPK